MPQAIVFDFDGVIVDTEPLHFAAFRQALPAFDMVLSRETYFSRYIGHSDAEILRRLLVDQHRRLSTEESERLLRIKDAAYRRQIEQGIDLAAGAAELIRRVSRRWALAICSGSKRIEIEEILGRADLLSPFSVIVAVEDVPVSKPDPAGYRLALSRLQARAVGLTAEICLAIEDSAAGITAARRAGMRVVAVCQTDAWAAGIPPDATIRSLLELSDARLEALLGRGLFDA